MRMDNRAKKMMQGHKSMTPMPMMKQAAKSRKIKM